MINTKLAVRPALQSDHTAIANLMYFEPRVHRHLDWRGPLEWLGVPEYWVLEQGDSIVSALACPPDPQGVAWLRFFAHVSGVSLQDAWQALWQVALPALKERGYLIGAITVSEWFGPLLLESGFSITQQIVVLEHDSVEFKLRPLPSNIVMRSMTDRDLQAVAKVDQEGFAPLWRNSIQALRSGYNQSGFATVALLDGEIVGYQISTRNSFGVHLARLAVLPACQGREIGYSLVQDLLLQTRRAGLRRLTVNTQNDNRMSLALYQKIGFELTGEQYTVYTLYTE
jgi:ribosomal protein S18 acetylase RimI-like enzyme